MSMEEDILKRDLSKAETQEAVQEIKQSAEDMGIDIDKLVEERLAAISAKAEAVETTVPAQVSQVESMGGSTDEVEKRTEGVDQKIGEVKAEAEERIEETKGEQVPAHSPEDSEVKEDPKDKKFAEMQARFTEDQQKKAENPENPINKISKVAETNSDAIKLALQSAGSSDFDQRVGKLNVTPQELETALPDLYRKGIISKDDYSYFIGQKSLQGGNLNIAETTRIIERTPKDIALEVGSEGVTGQVLSEWLGKVGQEVEKEMSNTSENNQGRNVIREPKKALQMVSNAGRFFEKSQVASTVEKVVDDYLLTGSNINGIMDQQGKSPVLENLCEAGFTDQAQKIIEKGVSNGTISSSLVLEYQKKGYFSEEQAKSILDKGGRLN